MKTAVLALVFAVFLSADARLKSKRLHRDDVDSGQDRDDDKEEATEDKDKDDDDAEDSDESEDNVVEASSPTVPKVNPKLSYSIPKLPDMTGTMAQKAKLQSELEKARDALAQNLNDQVAVNKEIKKLDDEVKLNHQVDLSTKAVADETQSPAMASFLGDMWKEMRVFAKPFYKEHLEEKLVDLEQSSIGLQKNFKDAKAALTAWYPRVAVAKTADNDRGD